MGKIVILDENTSNKIAAGEVIERPASVVKELVENSIDAGACSVTVEVKKGGIAYIRVTDNGSGIDEDDVEIAFERHATSKIRNANDLGSITTLGFRGEALSSIAAVSSVELTTRKKENPYGIYMNIKGGAVKEVKQVGSPVGTTFVISDLFYNTPARYKFLKKDSTESGYISEILNRIALAKPEISIKLIGNNSVVLHTPGNNDLLSTIFSIYGKDVSKNVLPLNYDDGKVRIAGYAGKPEISRATRDYQSIFVNGRYVKSKLVSAAVDEAYKTMLMKNKHPFIVLNMDLSPMLVDVNVHPTKMEVRFSDEQEIFRCVYHAVNNALLNTSLIRDVRLEEKAENIFKIKGNEFQKTNYTQQNIALESRFVKEAPEDDGGVNKNPYKNRAGEEEGSYKAVGDNAGTEKKENVEQNLYRSADMKSKVDGSRESKSESTREAAPGRVGKKSEEKIEEEPVCKSGEDTYESKEAGAYDILTDAVIIGQAFSTYILLQKDNELILIDQHAAHERIMFEHFKNLYGKREPLAQMLLAPVVVDLTFKEIRLLEEKKEYLNDLGFIFENFGNNSIILRAVPAIDDSNSIKELFLEILDELSKTDTSQFNLIADEVLYTVACKAAVKANNKLDNTEIKGILEKLAQARNPYTCPHGRPVIVKLSKHELEKMFKRIL